MLPSFWHAVSLLNPVVYLINGFRWAFYETGDVSLFACVAVTLAFLAIGLGIVTYTFRTGWRLRT